MDAGTLEMLQTSLEHVLTEDGDVALSERLSLLGWEEVLEDDAPAALQLLFETKGTTLSGADALGPVLARSIADSVGQPELAAAGVVLPSSLHPQRLSSVLDGDRLVVDGVATATPSGQAPALVPVEGAQGVRIAVVGSAVQWSHEPLGGTDASMGLGHVSATVARSDVGWIDGADAAAAWDAAVARGRWAIAAELIGIGRHVIAHAVEYTGQRKQYGRPIGSFQALQHRLASAHTTVAGASQVVAEAATSGSPWDALVAKALAGGAAENACTQAQQSYGAIGFTWEHELHRYLRRMYVLDWLFGDWRTLEREIGARLLASREVPSIGTL
jgi:hypothetical protein